MKCSYFYILIFSFCFYSCSGQSTFGTNELKLDKEIILSGVKGRIDHMDANPKMAVLYMAALGNNTLEIIDLHTGKRIHSIEGLSEPQGVGYVPETNEIIVANGGNGDCYFFSAKNFDKVATIHPGTDADDVRYDAMEHKIYVGYGEGGIAVIDPFTHKQIADIKLPAHPEGFQLDNGLKRIFVNVPDAHIIGVVDLKELKLIAKWNTNNLKANFPMSVDLTDHRLFIGYRHPAKLVELNGQSGAQLSSIQMISDVDDLYFDPNSARVYVSGGGGAIDIFQLQGNELKQISHIPTRSGARTSLLIPSLHLFVLAERSNGAKDADVLVYQTSK